MVLIVSDSGNNCDNVYIICDNGAQPPPFRPAHESRLPVLAVSLSSTACALILATHSPNNSFVNRRLSTAGPVGVAVAPSTPSIVVVEVIVVVVMVMVFVVVVMVVVVGVGVLVSSRRGRC